MNQLRLVLFGICLVLGAVFGWRVADSRVVGTGLALWQFPTAAPPKPPLPLTLDEARGRLQNQFASIPEYARYFDLLKSAFPAEYFRIFDGLALKLASADTLAPATPNMDRAFFQAARGLRQTHGILAAQAQTARVERIGDVQGRVMQALAGRDARLCVDFFYGSAEPDFFAFMGQNRALAADFAMAWLEAMADGKASALKRPDPDDADLQVFDDALVQRGLSREAIDALLESKVATPPLPDASLCQAGIIYFQTLGALPAEPRIRLMARLLALAARS